MRQDDINIFESYQQIQQLNEAGVIRSKLAGMTDWNSLKNKIKSGILKVGAGGLNKVGIGKNSIIGKSLRKDAIEYRKAARNAAKDAKIKKILKVHSGQIEKLAKELVEDLNKLKLNRSGLTWERVNQHMISMIKDELETQKSTYKKPKVKNEEPEEIEYSPSDIGGGTPSEVEPDIESEDEEEEPEEKEDEDYGEASIDYSPIPETPDEDHSESPIEDTNTNKDGSAKDGAYVDNGEYIYKKENGRWQQYQKAGYTDRLGKISNKDTYKGIASNEIKSSLEKIWQKQGRKVDKK